MASTKILLTRMGKFFSPTSFIIHGFWWKSKKNQRIRGIFCKVWVKGKKKEGYMVLCQPAQQGKDKGDGGQQVVGPAAGPFPVGGALGVGIEPPEVNGSEQHCRSSLPKGQQPQTGKQAGHGQQIEHPHHRQGQPGPPPVGEGIVFAGHRGVAATQPNQLDGEQEEQGNGVPKGGKVGEQVHGASFFLYLLFWGKESDSSIIFLSETATPVG